MNETTEELATADGLAQAPAPAQNRGRFRPGDERINRAGRPPKPKPLPPGVHPGDVAQRADRLMRFSFPVPELKGRLSQQCGPWVTNLPADFQIVAARVDGERVVFVVRSPQFAQLARGEPIPELRPSFHGLKWRQDWNWRP